MDRPKKRQESGEDVSRQYIDAVAQAYLNGGKEKASLKDLSQAFGITGIKVRKILITAGVYDTAISRRVARLREEGRTVEEIASYLCLSKASVHGYLPYTRAMYRGETVSRQAERLRLYRRRKAAAAQLQSAIQRGEEDVSALLWEALEAFANYPFQTAKNLRFTYEVRGNELFFTRKEKSVTRSSVEMALKKALELQRAGEAVTGPKKLGSFGASYLYPVFCRLGVIVLPPSE